MRGNILRFHYSIDRSIVDIIRGSSYASERSKGTATEEGGKGGIGGNRYRGRRNEERACVRLSVFVQVRRRQSRSRSDARVSMKERKGEREREGEGDCR